MLKSVTATDVMNFSYCKRIPYYVHVLKIPQFTTVKEYKGREKYDDFKYRSKRSKIIQEFPHLERKYDLYLECDGFSTKLDCVFFNDDDAFPLQLKYAVKPKKMYATTRRQLLLEAFLIEQCLGKKVQRGFVKYELSGDLVEVDLTDKSELFEMFKEYFGIIMGEKLPEPTEYLKRCRDCCYRRFCWGDK
ncbi:MAG: CRISPR-associated protein Cas4 [Candidatus Auribacter fodinae]|uniref:CRISPR-associated exonuclease Cas4 n=1 Tax=Candidatus Auribacter fodinae TaxID=2093366 RepID=A0A3A4QVP1_9BACT|nr:MAG: CRISPR-associated protein Cas4 [Candidatus Auribacter fodinae]